MSSTQPNASPNAMAADTAPIGICFSCDDKYAQHLGVAMLSILSSRAPNDRFSFYILDGGISEVNKCKIQSLKSVVDFEIQFITVDEALFADFPLSSDFWTRIVYYRLLIADLFPNLEKMLYLDSDIIVRESLAPLFYLDLTGIAFAAVPDVCEKELGERLRPFGFHLSHYCNAGVLMMNLAEFRKKGGFAFFCDFIQKNREAIRYQDQDVLNMSLQNQMKVLEPVWNTQTSEMPSCQRSKSVQQIETSVILHFIGPKPWTPGNKSPHRKFYHRYQRVSPWKNEYFRYCRESAVFNVRAFIKRIQDKRKRIFRIHLTKKEKYIVMFGRTVFGHIPSSADSTVSRS